MEKQVEYKSEEQFQSACCIWFWNTYHSERMRLFAVNNNPSTLLSGKMQQREGAKQRGLGIVAGVSDLVFIGDGFVYFIELKLPTGTQQDNQKEFEQVVRSLCHRYIIIRTISEFKELIYKLLSYGSEI